MHRVATVLLQAVLLLQHVVTVQNLKATVRLVLTVIHAALVTQTQVVAVLHAVHAVSLKPLHN
jgi:hypothetical protein